ncbi:hypothetical protein V8C43DRAFT_271173 [Trichoderma afarasin]
MQSQGCGFDPRIGLFLYNNAIEIQSLSFFAFLLFVRLISKAHESSCYFTVL